MDDIPLDEPAAMSDPALMDNMDDLFGEAADGLGVAMPPLPAEPLPSALVLRVAEIQRTGCCTKLAWSNTGSIAHVSTDGSKVTLRVMLRVQTTGQWKLSEESKHPILAPQGRRFVHIQFNGMGSDLVAVDEVGGMHMYSTSLGVLSRLQHGLDEAIQTDSGTELDAVVGIYWLSVWPVEFRSHYITAATKTNGRWFTQQRQRDPHAQRVHHPGEGRNALLHVTASGRLTLMYQDEMGTWHAIPHELDVFHSTKDLFTHAAIGEESDHVLLAAHDDSRRIRFYSITIHWNPSQPMQHQGVSMPSVAPTLEVDYLKTLENVAPQHPNPARLSHLRVLPPVPGIVDAGTQPLPIVLAVFTYAPPALDPSQPAQDHFSIIARWHVQVATQTLHDSFTKLRPNESVPVQPDVKLLTRQPDILTNKVILTVQPQCFNTLIGFGASDGTMDLRDSLSRWHSIENYGDTTSASSLPQSGLEHFPNEPSSHVALSPDGSALVFTKPDDSAGSKLMTLRSGWQIMDDGISDTKSLMETAVICLARQYAMLTYASATTDETLALFPTDLSLDMRVLFIKEAIRMMKRPVDVSMLDPIKQQQPVVLKELYLYRILSAQLVLGTRPDSMVRTFAGQYTYALLNLRLSGTALAQTITRQNQDDARPGTLHSLSGLIHWALDFIVFVIDTLITAQREIESGMSAKTYFEQLVKRTGSPAVHLLLCSFPRALLRMHTPYILNYLKLVQARIPGARSVEERQQLISAFEMARALPFSPKSFEELIAEVDTAVRQLYTDAGISTERRIEIELAMMTDGQLADELDPIFEILLNSGLQKLSESIDLGKLYFWDTNWLGLSRVLPSRGAKRYDVMKKTALTSRMKLRTCRRCGAEMEDIPLEKVRDLPPWLQHAQRHCICLNYWWSMS